MARNFCFEASTWLAVSPEECFRFHENPHNISAISPESLEIVKVNADTTAAEGREFEIVAKQFFMPIRWVGRWERVFRPEVLVDVGVRSPFKFWRHEHLFKAEKGGTRMTDRISLQPFGGPAATGVMRPFFSLFLAWMFRQRHASTRAHFNC